MTMQNSGNSFSSQVLTEMVMQSFAGTSDSRLKEIIASLVRHLHGFVREIEPTLVEWKEGIDFLTEVGQKCDAVRQEFVLLSDVLGISMLVETINDLDSPGATDSTVLGPFHMTESPVRELGESIDMLASGTPLLVAGSVRAVTGTPIPYATVDVWQCNEQGFYDVQQPDLQPAGNGRGLFTADRQGRFWFFTVTPSHYPIPTDGPVGKLLSATNRHPFRPGHIHLIAHAGGFRELTTHVFVPDSPYLDSDAVFAVKESLVGEFARATDEEASQFEVEIESPVARVQLVLSPESEKDSGTRIGAV
ncbi:Hydroxyquinol 1,2-dioxygenase (plasmid) [Rhodococcus opacus]|uniref:Hydroxyquinol 1,2-dioxygenase n=1 Tax=Rhodococcus opacus TaxID=37919 RepID=A0A1B1KJ08_RHOOP|nr:dioxygenase [Rhodococcus opacus]ANS32599.1 Hydroxyquinol 1,2-dioxygenase [Rhodococcus opacus]